MMQPWEDAPRAERKVTPVNRKLLALLAVPLAFAAEPKEYKLGAVDRWDVLSTGTSCTTTQGILTGVSTHCGKTGVRAYHVFSEDGFDYTVQPDTWDPLKAVQLGQEIKYRIDEKGTLWTPDPKHGACPWPCTGEKRREWKESGDPKHDAKYLIVLIEKRKTDSSPTLTNKDIIDMSHLGLSEALIIQKINTSKPAYDVSIPALKSLKDSGISDALISAMMLRQSQ
jgi:hypothetical protein